MIVPKAFESPVKAFRDNCLATAKELSLFPLLVHEFTFKANTDPALDEERIGYKLAMLGMKPDGRATVRCWIGWYAWHLRNTPP